MAKDPGKLAAPSLRIGRRNRSQSTTVAPDEVTAPDSVREPAPETGPATAAEPADDGAEDTVPLAIEGDPVATDEPAPPAARRTPVAGIAAAALTGVLVGVVLVGALAGVAAVSQSLRGTSSLGRAGIPVVIAVFALAVAVGALALRRLRVPSAASVSFIGTGLVCLIAMFFYTDAIATVAGGVGTVAIAAVTFVLARWLTATYLTD